jgi:hypothetical protein
MIEDFPSREEVARELQALSKRLTRERYRARGRVIVHLQVYNDGYWALRPGPKSLYDDTRGWWGSAILPPPSAPMKEFLSVAEELLDQAMAEADLEEEIGTLHRRWY